MRQYRSSRQLVLILIAILLPAGVLIGLATRVVRQETELAQTRALEARRTQVEQVRRELLARLDAVKLREINRWIRLPAAPSEIEQPPDSSLVFVSALDGDRLVMPWESAPKANTSREFAKYRSEGESLEFIRKDFAGAASAYHQAFDASRSDSESCEAGLLEARSLMKDGRSKEAAPIYHRMLRNCDAAADEDDIPYSLYAAERLASGLNESEAAIDHAIERVNKTRWISVHQAYLIRSLLNMSGSGRAIAARNLIEARIAEMDQMASLAKDFHRLKPVAETSWLAYGNEPWLITAVPAEPPLPELVFVISSSAVSRKFVVPGAMLAAQPLPGSESLGEGFRGVNVKFKEGQLHVASNGSWASIYAIGIGLILLVTAVAGFVLMRDVNRDLRMSELRSQFVASVSHELKTPLTAIRMFAETLSLGRARDARTHSEYLETIVNESERLTRLVDNVLDFSKIEQGKRIYQMRPANLANVVQSAARAMQYPLSQQGFTLNVAIHNGVGGASVDADAMEQAILNLLSNAMKYSGDSRDIDLSLRGEDREAVIEVRDRGIGIAPAEQTRIFEKFYRGPATGGTVAGTGLGLTVVQHVVQAHGGRIEIKSDAGAGSTLSIRIPASASSPSEVTA